MSIRDFFLAFAVLASIGAIYNNSGQEIAIENNATRIETIDRGYKG